jgi:basic membrane protein A
VTNTGDLFDDSFNEMIYNGLQEANTRFGWDARVLQSSSAQDYSRNIQEFLRGDCDLIVGLFQMADGVFRAAELAPETKFLVMDHIYDQPLKNVQTTIFATDQAAFLAGYTAASLTQTGKVGVFGGIDFPPVTDYMDGFALGVAYYNQRNSTNVEVLGWDPASHSGIFSGGFCCAAQGRQITQRLLDEGADVILPVAGTSLGAGALDAVKAHGNAFVIGVDTDWAVIEAEYADIILTSVVKNFTVSVTQAVQSIASGRFTGGVRTGTLETGEVGLAPFYQHDALISAQVKADLEEIRQAIIAGEIATRP